MMRLTLVIVGKTLFDADVESDSKEVGEAMNIVMDLFNTIANPFLSCCGNCRCRSYVVSTKPGPSSTRSFFG